jgi:hypothetical protein
LAERRRLRHRPAGKEYAVWFYPHAGTHYSTNCTSHVAQTLARRFERRRDKIRVAVERHQRHPDGPGSTTNRYVNQRLSSRE